MPREDQGAGHTFQSNTVRNAPHAGILGRGNDCKFLHNSFRDLAFESTDTGAFQTGRSWVRRGNLLEGNTFERVRNTQGMSLGYPQVMAIYLDDMQAGYTLVGNTFIDVQVHMGHVQANLDSGSGRCCLCVCSHRSWC